MFFLGLEIVAAKAESGSDVSREKGRQVRFGSVAAKKCRWENENSAQKDSAWEAGGFF